MTIKKKLTKNFFLKKPLSNIAKFTAYRVLSKHVLCKKNLHEQTILPSTNDFSGLPSATI